MRYLFFSILVAVSFWACSGDGLSKQEVADILTENPWRWDVQAIKDTMDKRSLSEQDYNIIMSTLRRMETGVFEFKKDGTMTLFAMDETRAGTWELANATTLTMTLPGISVVPSKIIKMERGWFMLGEDKTRGVLFPKILVPAGVPSTPTPKDNIPATPTDTTKSN
jgi:hypothetical protein